MDSNNDLIKFLKKELALKCMGLSNFCFNNIPKYKDNENMVVNVEDV